MSTPKEVKLTKWDPKIMSFKYYEARYKAVCKTRGDCWGFISGEKYDELPPPGEANITAGHEKAIAENARAHNDLLLTMPTIKLMNLVEDSVSERAPNGCARQGWINVKAELDKVTTTARDRVITKFRKKLTI